MIRTLKRFFSGAANPEEMISQFRHQAEVFDGEQADLNYQTKRLRARIEGILNRGKDAARNEDSLGKRHDFDIPGHSKSRFSNSSATV
jgi:hypothetical protein